MWCEKGLSLFCNSKCIISFGNFGYTPKSDSVCNIFAQTFDIKFAQRGLVHHRSNKNYVTCHQLKGSMTGYDVIWYRIWNFCIYSTRKQWTHAEKGETSTRIRKNIWQPFKCFTNLYFFALIFSSLLLHICHSFVELKKSDHDNQPMGRTILARLQISMGPARVWRCRYAACAFRSHLATRHRLVQ